MTVDEVFAAPDRYLGRRIEILGPTTAGPEHWAWFPSSSSDGQCDPDKSRGILIKYPRINTFILWRGGAAFPSGETAIVEGILAESNIPPFPFVLLDISRVACKVRHSSGGFVDCDVIANQLPDEQYIRDIIGPNLPREEIPAAVCYVLQQFRYL